jgi:hypothetical protein
MSHDWRVKREEGTTFCENPHPVRLGRNPQPSAKTYSERNTAIAYGKKGYLCPGGEEHSYPVWIVYDANDEDQSSSDEIFDDRMEALAHCERLKRADLDI